MRWRVVLEGPQRLLEELAETFKSGLLVVRKVEDQWVLCGAALAAAPDADTARALAAELVARLLGAMLLQRGSGADLRIGAVQSERDDGKVDQFLLPDLAVLRLQFERPTVAGGGTVPASAPLAGRWLQLANSDPDVADALAVFGQQHTWGRLYFVFDLVQGRVGKKVHSWQREAECDRFTHTAQCRSAVGREARHGKPRSPPKHPMSLDEASRLVSTVLMSWLDSLP